MSGRDEARGPAHRYARAALAALLLVAAGGRSVAAEPPTAPPSARRLVDRRAIAAALTRAGVLDDERQVVHLSHVCDLRLGKRHLPVVDLRELVPGASTARGVNRIIVLNDQLVPVRTLEYATERPLFCRGAQLFVYGDLSVGSDEGNVLEFADGGRTVRVTRMEVNHLPAPAARTLPSLLQ